jgi:hypothetical protein
MVVLTTSDYIQIIAAGIYAAALFYTVITFRRSKKLDQITQTNVIVSAWREQEIELDKVPQVLNMTFLERNGLTVCSMI